MGVYNNTYVGVYVLVKPKVHIEEQRKMTYVSASGRQHSENIKFDPQDGSPVTSKEEIVLKEEIFSSWYKIFDKFSPTNQNLALLNEDLFINYEYMPTTKDGYVIWLLNSNENHFKKMDEVDLLNLTGIDTLEKINAFKEKFNSSLLAIKDYVQDIKICYGVINYQS